MIAFLKGILEHKTTSEAVLDVQGVGYRVEISANTYQNLPAEGETVRLLVHHHITDSDQRLFGFFSSQEQRLFEKLITVKGVGPKLGLTIMSGMQAPALAEAIIQQDQQALSRISGIGKKTAQRLILELKDKILDGVDTGSPAEGNGPPAVREEAISALEALGFRKKDAESAVMDIIGQDKQIDVSGIVKKALAKMNK